MLSAQRPGRLSGYRRLLETDDEARSRFIGPVKQELPAMPAHQLGRDGQSEPRPFLARAAVEGFEEVLARLFRQARPGVTHSDFDPAVLLLRRNADLAGLTRRDDRLPRIAREVAEYAVELFGVHHQFEPRGNVTPEGDLRRASRKRFRSDHVLDDLTQRNAAEAR